MSTVKSAFFKSLPVLFGYEFLGIAYGILMQQAGYGPGWALAGSLFVYAGSLQFVMVSWLAAGAALPVVAVMSFLINSRHMFYGISFVDVFRKMGKAFPYMVFSLTDETYSILVSEKEEPGIDLKKEMLLVALFDHAYWVSGSVIGALLGQVLPFDATGIDFSMTALFTVLFLEKWLEFRSHIPAVIGLVSSVAFLLILGPDSFILPSLIVTVAFLMFLKKPITAGLEKEVE